MSNATSTIHRENLNAQPTIAARASTQGLRVVGAELAPGFAQVLQAFDQPSEQRTSAEDSGSVRDPARGDQSVDATPSESGEESGQSADQSTPGRATSDGSDQQTGHQSSDEASNPNNPTSGGDGDTHAGERSGEDARPQPINDGQPKDADLTRAGSATAEIADQAQIKEASRLDLLVHRGDMAKLSLRGLVRSLRTQSSPDVTTIAVQTRMGEIKPSETVPSQPTNQNHGVQATPKPDAVQPDVAPSMPQRFGPPINDPAAALSDSAPDSPRSGGESQARKGGVQQTPMAEIPTRADQSRADVQQTRSVRAEAGSAVQSNAKIDLSRIGSLQNTSAQNQVQRVEGAMTSRAISSVEAGGESATLKATQQQAHRLDTANNDTSAQRAAVIAQVQRGLAQMLRSGKGDMMLKLTPGHLGEVRIQMKQDGDRISLRLTAGNEQARELLSSGSKELMHAMLSKGISVERIQVDVQATDSDAPRGDASDLDQQGGERDQGHTPNGREHGQEQHKVVPLVHEPGGQIHADHDSIWTELGLDAIA